MLIGLAVLGVVYANTEPEEKTKGVQYQPVDLCKLPVFMDVGFAVEIKDCNKHKIELKQVTCKAGDKFPCYEGCDVITVKANFPAIFSASIDKSTSDEDMLKEVNLYWEDGVNTIQGTGEWEELKLCLEVCNVDIYKFSAGTVKVGDIQISVRPPNDPKDDTNDDTEDDKKLED